MKRSEMIKSIGDLLPDHLTVKGFHGDRYQVANYLLKSIEEAGMLPPETDLRKCSDPELSIGPSYFEEHVPQRITLGWDDE